MTRDHAAGTFGSRGIGFTATWSDLGPKDDGAPYEIMGASERCVQVSGDLSGARVFIDGSVDGTHFHPLYNPDGAPLMFRTPGLEAIREPVRFIRPRVDGGMDETKVEVVLMIRSR